jgi:hypothetical protein
MQSGGIVTLSNGNRASLTGGFFSRGGCHSLPYAQCFVAKLAKCFAGNEMALDVEIVVHGGVDREKSLS